MIPPARGEGGGQTAPPERQGPVAASAYQRNAARQDPLMLIDPY